MSYEVFTQLLMNGAVLYLAYQIYRLSQRPISVDMSMERVVVKKMSIIEKPVDTANGV